MAALLQPNQVGIREDLADYIAVVDNKSTPFTSMAPKGKSLGNMTFDWQVDNYAAPTMGGVIDGADVSTYTNPSANRTRLQNYAQAFRLDLRIGFIAETQNVAGVSSKGELGRGIAKRMLELKRSMEATFLCTNQAAQLDNGSVPYLTGSLGNWVDTSGSSIGQPTSAYATPDDSKDGGTTDAFTETNVQDILTSIYGQVGQIRNYSAIVGTTLKRAFTNLTNGGVSSDKDTTNSFTQTSVRTFNQDIGDATYKSSVDIFQGDFGTLTLHPSVFIGGTAGTSLTVQDYKGYVIPMGMVEMRYSKLPEVKELPDNGGGPARLIQAIAGLCVKNPLGFGYFDLTA